MRLLRAALIVAGGTVVTAWLVASSLAPGRESAGPSVRTLTARPARPAQPTHTERLRRRLAAMPDTLGAARDPFRFVDRARPARAPAAAHAAVDEPAAPSAPPTPVLQLIGVAEDAHDGAIVRTAIVSGMNQVYLVTEGQQIALRFLVRKVEPAAIELEDLTDNDVMRLTLR